MTDWNHESLEMVSSHHVQNTDYKAYEAGVSPKVILECTHIRALNYVTLEQLQT